MLIRLKFVRARRGSPEPVRNHLSSFGVLFFLPLVSFRLKVETKHTEGQINLHVETVKPPVFFIFNKKKCQVPPRATPPAVGSSLKEKKCFFFLATVSSERVFLRMYTFPPF